MALEAVVVVVFAMIALAVEAAIIDLIGEMVQAANILVFVGAVV